MRPVIVFTADGSTAFVDGVRYMGTYVNGERVYVRQTDGDPLRSAVDAIRRRERSFARRLLRRFRGVLTMATQPELSDFGYYGGFEQTEADQLRDAVRLARNRRWLTGLRDALRRRRSAERSDRDTGESETE